MSNDPILAAFDRRQRQHPDEPIVVSMRRRASAGEVDLLARAAVDRLAAAGLGAGSLVGLAAPNGAGFLAGFLAVRRARCAALAFDARTPEAERQRIGGELGAAALLVCRRAWPRGGADFSLLPIAGGRRSGDPRSGDPASLADDIAAVKLTSGSTGNPRGILTPSAGLVADDAALAVTMGLSDDERILAAIPMSHSYGLSSVVLPALMRRSVLVLPEGAKPFDPLAAVRAREVTFLPTVPAFLDALVRMARPPRLPPSLRLVVTAGAPLRPETAARFREIYRLPVRVFYGASECGGITFDRDGTAGERGTLGTPVAGVHVTLEPPPGEVGPTSGGERGAVTVASKAVARGYLPATDPCLGDGRFRTRDLASWRGGELVLEGRLDEMINVRGKKVDPREVEAVLRGLAGVEEVVTLGVPRPGGETIVRSFIACRPGELTREAVVTWCRDRLADYKVPRSVVLLAEIPRTARGKLDRRSLLALAPEGRPVG